MHSLHLESTGQEVTIKQTERCCATCKHSGSFPDGCGECSIIVDYQDGKPWMVEDWDPEIQSTVSVISHATIGADDICDYWEKKEE